MKSISVSLVLLSFLFVISCEKETKEDVVKDINKKGAIETQVSVEHHDSIDVLVTKHKIWKDKALVKEVVKRDTIPSLGDTLRTDKDANGNLVTGTIKKDYEFYITVQ